MPNKHGDFIWYELMTSDADAAQDFYAALHGWKFGDGQGPKDYRHISMDGVGIGGVMPLTNEMTENGARPCWLGYIAVDDVDAEAKKIEQAGGEIHLPPSDIPGTGRFAMVADPQGAMFYIMKSKPPADDPEATSEAFAARAPIVGHCAWNELATSDPKSAMTFYKDQFGWEKDSEMDMGPMGTYEFLRHDFLLGAMMKRPKEMPVSAWTYYFRVPDIDEAEKTINANGGTPLHEPQEIPGDEYMINAVDPQGAFFAVVGVRKK